MGCEQFTGSVLQIILLYSIILNVMFQHSLIFFVALFAVCCGKPYHELNEMSNWGSRQDCNGYSYSTLKAKFLREGYVVFRSCTLSNETIDQAASFTKRIDGIRSQDAWGHEDSVLNIAVDPDSVNILSYLNSHSVFPFQTLNFPVATQQPVHSDVVHFDTLPERGLMTASWVALEDIHPDAGPLIYYPRSHTMGLWDMDEIGSRLNYKSLEYATRDNAVSHYEQYERDLQKTINRLGLKSRTATIKKGESFVWAASLLHGGSKLKDPTRTRTSQVTHYYMTGAKKFWVPKLSIPSIDHIIYKCNIPTCTVTHSKITNCAERRLELFKQRVNIDTSNAHELYGSHCV